MSFRSGKKERGQREEAMLGEGNAKKRVYRVMAKRDLFCSFLLCLSRWPQTKKNMKEKKKTTGEG